MDGSQDVDIFSMDHIDVVGMDIEIEEESLEETPRKRSKRPKHKKHRRDNYDDSDSEAEVSVSRAPLKKPSPKKSPVKNSPVLLEPVRISERTPKPSLRLKEAESSAQLLERSSSERVHRPSQKMREAMEHEQMEPLRSSDRTPKPSLKLKIKLSEAEANAKRAATSSPARAPDKSSPSLLGSNISLNVPSPGQSKLLATGSGKKKKGKGKDSGASSDEERWLDAIESGKLEEVDDELKKIKDPKLMTARQRAMFEKKSDIPGMEEQPLMALPSGYKEKVLTEEMIQKRALKLQKRKQQAEEKREKDKKMTMDRLLKKQASKSTKPASSRKSSIPQEPLLLFVNNENETHISFPVGIQGPLQEQKPRLLPPAPLKCGAPGCSNRKRYSCSKTGVPLCSLECYRSNLAAVK